MSKIVKITDLNDYIDNAEGTVTLVDEVGGYLALQGHVQESSQIVGHSHVECDHGRLYFDNDTHVEAAEL